MSLELPGSSVIVARDQIIKNLSQSHYPQHTKDRCLELLAWIAGTKISVGGKPIIVDIDIRAREARMVCDVIEPLIPSGDVFAAVRERLRETRVSALPAATSKTA